MKILHVTFGLPPYASGGLPLYVKGLVEQQLKDGDLPYILEPGSMFGKKKIYHVKNTNIFRLNGAMQVVYNFGLSSPKKYIKKYNKKIFAKFLQKHSFDVINVHSFMGIPIEFFEVARSLKIKIIYTTHDYFGLCLRTNYIDYKNNICDPNCNNNCSECNYCRGLSAKKALIMQTSFYKKNRNSKIISIFRKMQRNKLNVNSDCNIKMDFKIINQYDDIKKYNELIFQYFDFYIYNSELTQKIFESRVNAKGQICQILLPDIIRKKTDYVADKTKITFIGRKEFYKGVTLLIDTIKSDSSYQCKFYGDDYNDLLANTSNCFNMGIFKRYELQKILSETSLLVVPSLWYETFGLVTLEALAYGVPVIVSSRVGSGYLLKNAPFDVIFEPNVNDLKKCIDLLFENDNLLKYREWIQNQKYCFNMNEHSKKIKQIYQKVIENE